MKIRMLADADHRPLPAVMQAFREGRIYNLPRNTAEALIERGKAVLHDLKAELEPGFRSVRAAEKPAVRDASPGAAPADPETHAEAPAAAEADPSQT